LWELGQERKWKINWCHATKERVIGESGLMLINNKTRPWVLNYMYVYRLVCTRHNWKLFIKSFFTSPLFSLGDNFCRAWHEMVYECCSSLRSVVKSVIFAGNKSFDLGAEVFYFCSAQIALDEKRVLLMLNSISEKRS